MGLAAKTSCCCVDAGLDDARSGLKRLYTVLQAVPPESAPIDWAHPFASRFREAMDNDFSTPEAVAAGMQRTFGVAAGLVLVAVAVAARARGGRA